MLKEKKYTWGGSPCVRNGENMNGEAHPCYYCGTLIPVTGDTRVCEKCHFQFCPKCGICFCNGTQKQQAALVGLRDMFCCKRAFFQQGVTDFDKSVYKWELALVPRFKDALDNCRRMKGCKGNY